MKSMDNLLLTQNNADSDTKIDAPKKYFPSDVLKWMKKNASPKMALKLMQICRYFQHKKFPYFVVNSFYAYCYGLYYTDLDDAYLEWNTFEDIPSNLWITNEIDIFECPNVLSIHHYFPKIAVCDAIEISFGRAEFSLHDFKVLTASGSVRIIYCFETYIRNENNEMASLEDILVCLPNIQEIDFCQNVPSFSSIKAARKKWNHPNLKQIELRNINEIFNAETFIEFMKKHKTVKFNISVSRSLTLFEYGPQLQEFVDEVIEAADLRYPPPYIDFPYQTKESISALKALNQTFSQN